MIPKLIHISSRAAFRNMAAPSETKLSQYTIACGFESIHPGWRNSHPNESCPTPDPSKRSRLGRAKEKRRHRRPKRVGPARWSKLQEWLRKRMPLSDTGHSRLTRNAPCVTPACRSRRGPRDSAPGCGCAWPRRGPTRLGGRTGALRSACCCRASQGAASRFPRPAAPAPP